MKIKNLIKLILVAIPSMAIAETEEQWKYSTSAALSILYEVECGAPSEIAQMRFSLKRFQLMKTGLSEEEADNVIREKMVILVAAINSGINFCEEFSEEVNAMKQLDGMKDSS